MDIRPESVWLDIQNADEEFRVISFDGAYAVVVGTRGSLAGDHHLVAAGHFGVTFIEVG